MSSLYSDINQSETEEVIPLNSDSDDEENQEFLPKLDENEVRIPTTFEDQHNSQKDSNLFSSISISCPFSRFRLFLIIIPSIILLISYFFIISPSDYFYFNSFFNSTDSYNNTKDSTYHLNDSFNIEPIPSGSVLQPSSSIDSSSSSIDSSSSSIDSSSSSIDSSSSFISIKDLKRIFILKPTGYGRTNNQFILFREFLLYSKVLNMTAVVEDDVFTFMDYVDFGKLNKFFSIIRLPRAEIHQKCPKIEKVSSICPFPKPHQYKNYWDEIKNGQIAPYHYWPHKINYVHSTHRRDHNRKDCAKYYSSYKDNKCLSFVSGVDMFFSFDYSMDPSLFYKFHELFQWKSIIYEKVDQFNSFFSKKFGVKSFHYLAIHLRLTDLGFELPTDDEVLSTIESELKRMDHLPNLKLFIATDNHGDRRIIELKIRFASILLEDSNTNIHFSHSLEHIFFDMQMCINADHFLGLDYSTLAFNINMLRFFGPKKYPLNSSNFWPKFYPTTEGKPPYCCFPNMISISCFGEDFSCYPYLNTSYTPIHYLRNINETYTEPIKYHIYVKYQLNSNRPFTLIDFHHHFNALRFIFAVSKIWNRKIILQKDLESLWLRLISQRHMVRFVPYEKGKQCSNGADFSKIWRKCFTNSSISTLFNKPFQYFPFDLLISSILPSLTTSEEECIDLYQKPPPNECIIFDLEKFQNPFSFDWSYRPSLIFDFHKFFLITSAIAPTGFLENFNTNLLTVYISPSIYSQINNKSIYIDVIKHELKLLQVSPQHEYEHLFIFPLNMSSPLYLTIVEEFGDILVKHPSLSGHQLFLFYTFLSSLSQRFLGDESIVSQNIFFMRTYGNNNQFPASNTSFWPNLLPKSECEKPECNQISFESFPYKASHPQEYSKYPYYYTLPLPPIIYTPRKFVNP